MGATRSTVVRGGEVDSSTTRLPLRSTGTMASVADRDRSHIRQLVCLSIKGTMFTFMEWGGYRNDESICFFRHMGKGQPTGGNGFFHQPAQTRFVDVDFSAPVKLPVPWY